MKTYRNRKTGVEITVDSEIVCDDWELVKAPDLHTEEKPKRKPRAKKEEK